MSYVPPPNQGTARPTNGSIGWPAAIARSLLAAGGALAGGLLAVPLAGGLFIVLFQWIGIGFVEKVVSETLDDLSGIEAFFAAIFLVIAAFAIAVIIVVALVAPVVLVVPMITVAVTLRLVKAGLITRTIGLMLATVLGMALAALVVANVLDLRLEWWLYPPILTVGVFLARLLVEWRRPDLAAVPDRQILGRRGVRLVVAWLVIVLIGVAGAIAVVLLGAQVRA